MISVIVPVYMSEKTLHRCMESLLNQTYGDLEIILVNDGSTDKSGEICNKYQHTDSRVKVINKDNGGVSSARNVGIDVATGEYIGFVDSDDFVDSEMFEALLSDITSHSCDLAICSWYNVVDGLINEEKNMITEFTVMNQEEAIAELLKDSFKGFLCNKLFKRDAFEGVRLEEELTMCEDFLAVFEILKSVKKVSVNPRPLYYYVRHNQQPIFNYRNHKSTDFVFQRVYGDIRSCYVTLIRLAQFAICRNSVITICNLSLSDDVDWPLFGYHYNLIRRNVLGLFLGVNGNARIKFYGASIVASGRIFKYMYKNMKYFAAR